MTKNATNNLMCVVSGLLLGLSVPSFPWLPLGFLGWVWLVPLLFELKKTASFGALARRVGLSVSIGFALISLWVINASVIGFAASTLMGIVVWTIPLLFFYLIRQRLGWNYALWSLPFFWTAWEWLYHRTDFSFGAVRLGYTQADLIWLIQYADLTGVEGVTFWLVLLNVSIYAAAEKLINSARDETGRVETGISAGRKYAAAFRRLDGGESALVLLPIFLFVLPLLYAADVFLRPAAPAQKITIVAVQPNISPFAAYTPKQTSRIFGRQIALTDKALKETPPDLIVWHEAAVPYFISENAEANSLLAAQLTKWNTPLLTGLIEVKNYSPDQSRPLLLEAQNRNQEFFNAAALLTPEDAAGNILQVNLVKMYLKRRLMPFLEQVPFADRYPLLDDLKIPIGVRPRLSQGDAAATFELPLKNGAAARFGTMICYENLYPETAADLVRGGAQFLTAITNEGFFADSQGQYQLAAFSRFRSIETRRAMVRAAATGITWATDKFGRTTEFVPMHSEQILKADVGLSDEQTLYVCWGNWFPAGCLFFVFFVSGAAFWRAFRRRLF